MPDLLLCSRQDVIDLGFGGDTAEIIKLTKSDPTAWNPALLDLPIKLASGQVEQAAGNNWSLNYSADPSVYPFAIRSAAAILAVWWTWFSYSRGQAAPDLVQTAKTAGDEALERLRASKQGIGTVKTAPRRLYGVAGIDTTSGGTFPRMTLDGWRRLG